MHVFGLNFVYRNPCKFFCSYASLFRAFISRSPVSAAGIQQIEALHYAVDKINDDPDILPQVKLGIDLYGLGSCTDKVAQRLMNLTKIASRKTEPIVGIIGPETSDETRYLFNQPAHSIVSIDICFK